MRNSILILMAVLGLVTGCVHPSYSLTFRTPSGQEVRNLTATSAAFSTTSPRVNDRKKVECCINRPIPETVFIAWESLDGSRHQKTILVSKRLPREFDIRRDGLIFQIDDRADDVQLSFEVWYEKYRSKELQPK